MKHPERGVTLLELLLVITLLSLLSVAMFTALRIGLSAFGKADDKLMTNRRAAGAQRILQSELQGVIPAMALCGAGDPANGPTARMTFFGGEPAALRLVSTFSLREGWRGRPQILELFVIPGEERGVRLVVNEIPYANSRAAGRLCKPRPEGPFPLFPPPQAQPQSFVLADLLAYCRFAYLAPAAGPGQLESWKPAWTERMLPLAIRVEMAPLDADASQVQPISITAPVYLHRDPEIPYVDY